MVYPATVELTEAYEVGPQEGVYVYILTPQKDHRISDTFIVTLGDGDLEVIWGHGNTIADALHDAEASWQRVAGDEFGENPFSLALRRRADQEDWRWE